VEIGYAALDVAVANDIRGVLPTGKTRVHFFIDEGGTFTPTTGFGVVRSLGSTE
jgi:hypothetical protein